MYFYTTQQVYLGRVDIKRTISPNSLKISMPLPWLAAAGLINQMLLAQCFIGVRSFGENPFESSLYRYRNSVVSESSRLCGKRNVVGVESNAWYPDVLAASF
jgi:hypothetical protein